MNEKETSKDIIAEMRKRKYGDEDCAVKWCLTEWADRLDAAHNRERGDCAKLREAIERIRSEAYECDQGGEYLGEGPDPGFDRIVKLCDAALAATNLKGDQL